MKTIFVLLYLFLVTIGDVDLQKGDPENKAMEILGEPTFEYTHMSDTIYPMTFGVYGWKTDSCWYGIQTQNNIIIMSYKFEDEETYLNFITKD